MLRPSTLAPVGCLLLLGIVAAHEHHSDEIPEGERISADPIVRPLLRYMVDL